MDSAIGNFQFGASLFNRVDQLSPNNSMSDDSLKLNIEFGHGEFNKVELKKIVLDARFAEIAISDPNGAKSCDIHLNWNTRCRLCKQKPPPAQFTILQVRSQGLTSYAAVFARNTNNVIIQVMIHLHKDYSELTNQNNELKFRLKAMKQQAQPRDVFGCEPNRRIIFLALDVAALHEELTAEVQCLKLAKMEEHLMALCSRHVKHQMWNSNNFHHISSLIKFNDYQSQHPQPQQLLQLLLPPYKGTKW
ncbi:bZIP transcription factor 30-like [Primulina huaijiensis]|uniref:bZIP transcription factor 30-like n=1 Tax=Primulina huaijiensis TaxID=1492673 RepID=UPI003CC787AC